MSVRFLKSYFKLGILKSYFKLGISMFFNVFYVFYTDSTKGVVLLTAENEWYF